MLKYADAFKKWMVNCHQLPARKVMEICCRNIKHANVPSLDIGMKNCLWGLTFYLVTYALTMIQYRLGPNSV